MKLKIQKLSFINKWLLFVGVGSFYYMIARLGLVVAFNNSNASLIWPASGFALAMVFFVGYRIVPAITFASFLVNVVVFFSHQSFDILTILSVSACIALGNSLECLLGAYLLRWWIKSSNPLNRPHEIFQFVITAALACFTSAIVGALALGSGHIVSWSLFKTVLLTWWIGDLVGVLVVTPLLITMVQQFYDDWRKSLVEIIFFFVVLFMTTQMIFAMPPSSTVHISKTYLVIPILLCIAFRYSQRETTFSVAMVAALAAWYTVHGFGPFVATELNDTLISLQTFIGVLAITMMSLVAAISDRRKAHYELQQSNTSLEEHVQERTQTLEKKTHELMSINSELERFNRTVVGREKRIMELKQEINRLSSLAGQALPYHSPLQSDEMLELEASEALSHDKELREQRLAALNVMEDAEEARKRLERIGEELKKRERIMQSLLEDLHESNIKTLARLAAIVEFSEDAIIGNNLDWVITSWNQGAEKIFKYTSSEVVGEGVSLMIPSDRGDELSDFLKQIKQGKSIEHYETVCLKKDGSPIDVSMTVSPIKDNNLRITGISIIARDITERKRLEQIKDSFLSTVSHELRTPLSILKMGIDNLEQGRIGQLDQDEMEMIRVFKKNTDRLERLINDLLDLSRLESGKTKIKPVLMQVDVLINELLQGFQLPAKEYGITLKGSFSENVPQCLADPDLIARVLTNLLNNALRFAKSEVVVEVKTLDTTLEVSVIDDGPGIKPEHFPSLFDKFIQINRPIGGAGYKGTGLGLAISKEIVELHGGKIWVDSEVGHGSKFHFTLLKKDKT